MKRRLFLPAAVVGCLFLLALDGANATDQTPLGAWVGAVLDTNPRARSAQSALDAAQARERAADQPLYNPELDVEYEDASDITKTLGLTQTIDWGDKRGARTNMATLERERRAAELAGVRQALAAALLTALAEYLSTDKLMDLAGQRQALMQRFLVLTEQRRQAGDLGQVELDLARLAATESRLQLAHLRGTRVQAEQALLAITDRGTDGWPVLADVPDLARLDNTAIDTLLEQLPALRAAHAQMAMARAAVEFSRRQRRADPTLGLRGGREASNNLIGLSLSIPLFVRNNFSAEVDAANAEAIQIEQDAQDQFRRSRARLISTARRFELIRTAWDDWLHTGQASLESQTQLLERLWRAGELSTSDYLVQLKQTLDTRTAAVKLRGSLWQAWFEWLAASGKTEFWLGLRH